MVNGRAAMLVFVSSLGLSGCYTQVVSVYTPDTDAAPYAALSSPPRATPAVTPAAPSDSNAATAPAGRPADAARDRPDSAGRYAVTKDALERAPEVREVKFTPESPPPARRKRSRRAGSAWPVRR